ncbi:nickel-dependent hydrogenase large subunit [Arcobacter sp. YIC-80]|uniref:nickel-dependent hydrogenase large subunit n=1 Tax=Arcobacter sp. YIC-80 TaxID=3376683 RepID=UPI0038507EBC
MKTIDIVERIEGEARLNCTWEDNIVKDVQIDFLNFRGFEYILEEKPALDALIYTPRICGICGQAHLKATVEALENIYKDINEELVITNKAKILRQIGLNIEILDSHIKWFYMFILPDVIKLKEKDLDQYTPLKGQRWLEACKVASETIKALAILGGQWPHTSYMIPGGVVSDPTLLDLTSMINYLDSATYFFENSISGVSFDKYLSFSSVDDLNLLNGDLKYFTNLSFEYSLQKYGTSYDRHIALSDSSVSKRGRLRQRLTDKLDLTKIKENTQRTFSIENDIKDNQKHTWSKAVTYDLMFYETGPLSRSLVSNNQFISQLHKSYKDSVFTRVMARVDEIARLLQSTKQLIKQVDISEESYIKPKISLKDIQNASAKSVVEACRGSLYHNISLEKGIIKKYDVITPTVWNLGPQIKDEEGVAQRAIIGSPSLDIAKIVLRSFDVCSVCTTH